MVCNRIRNVFIISFTATIIAIGVYCSSKTVALSRACQNSQACLDAARAEEEANANAANAANTADSYRQAVAYKNSEIANKTAQIEETKVQIAQILSEINAAEQKLEKQQTALAKLLSNIHFNYNNEPILLLASANSISDLAERQAREESIKEQVTNANKEIKSLKDQLEAKRIEAENTLAIQKIAEEELIAARAELQSLVSQYEADSAAYSAKAEEARLAKIAAEEEEQRKNPDLYRSAGHYSGVNTYEWQADCPQKQDYYTTYFNGHYIGGYVCECVSYAGWKAYEAHGVYLSWGNANTWDDYARYYGYVVNNTPAARTIGQTDDGWAGHVFWVESVNADGSINVTEYNNWYATGQTLGSYHMGDFGARVIPAYQVSQYNYIHF